MTEKKNIQKEKTLEPGVMTFETFDQSEHWE